MHTIEPKVGSYPVRRMSVFVATAVGLFATSASASTIYWGELMKADGAYGFKGDCTLCHTTPAGGEGTATRPFGDNLVNTYGLGGNDLEKFKDVMAQVAADGLDTDKDGATDIVEISGGGDPNDAAVLPGGFEPPLPAEYGCVGTIAGRHSSTDGAALCAAALAALVLVFKLRR